MAFITPYLQFQKLKDTGLFAFFKKKLSKDVMYETILNIQTPLSFIGIHNWIEPPGETPQVPTKNLQELKSINPSRAFHSNEMVLKKKKS